MIGSHVARELVHRRASLSCALAIHGIVRPRSDLSALRGVLEELTLHVCDIIDSRCVEDVVGSIQPAVVYHYAAQATNSFSDTLPQLTLDVNIHGTLNLLEAVRRRCNTTRTRVLVAGSSTEYGATADTWAGPLPEHAPLEPVSQYGVSKVATEKLSHQYWRAHGVRALTARIFIHVGVGGIASLAIHDFCQQIARIERGLAPPVIRHGNLATRAPLCASNGRADRPALCGSRVRAPTPHCTGRDMTDARDSAATMVDLAELGTPGETYNIGSGHAVGIDELLALAISMARVPITAKQDAAKLRAYDEKVLVADNRKVRALTGWVPSTNMSQTTENILNYWRANVDLLYCSGSRCTPNEFEGGEVAAPRLRHPARRQEAVLFNASWGRRRGSSTRTQTVTQL